MKKKMAQQKMDFTFLDCIKCLYRFDCSGVNLQQTTSTICATKEIGHGYKIKSIDNQTIKIQSIHHLFFSYE